jgi:hypothetical protein
MRQLLLACLALSLCTSSVAHAQERPRAAVLTPATPAEADAGLASAFERVLRARLDALEVVVVEGTPALNLRDLQLAVGCVAENATCLRAVAEQLQVDALVIPTIDHAGDALVGGITYFTAGTGESETATRRTEGERAPNELLAEVDPMVRELFDLPPPEEPIEETYELDPNGGAGGPAPIAPPPEEPGMSPLPLIVGGLGVAAVAVGVVFALSSESTEGDFVDAPTGTRAEVDAAIELRDQAESEATIANILLGVGGALVIAGVALFVVMEVDGGEEEQPPVTAVAPWIGPDGAGIAIAGTFGGAL